MLVDATVMSLRRSISVSEEEHKRRLRRKFGRNVAFNNIFISVASCNVTHGVLLGP